MNPGADDDVGFWTGFGRGLNAGAASVNYAFARPIAWLTGYDFGTAKAYKEAWAATGLQGTSTQRLTDLAAGISAVAGYGALVRQRGQRRAAGNSRWVSDERQRGNPFHLRLGRPRSLHLGTRARRGELHLNFLGRARNGHNDGNPHSGSGCHRCLGCHTA